MQAKQLLGLYVIATASRPESSAACTALGADLVINHREPLQAQLKAAGIDGVDYIYNAFDAGTWCPLREVWLFGCFVCCRR